MKTRHGFVSNSSSTSFVISSKSFSIEEIKDGVELLCKFYEVNVHDCAEVAIVDEEFIKLCKDFGDYAEGIKKGDIVINSADDNSIPFGMQNLFEDKYDAARRHFG